MASQQIFPFAPSNSANFQFQATIDGQLYNCIVTFNLYGQRYYLSVTDLSQTEVLYVPVVPSSDTYNLSLGLGYFDETIIFRESSQSFEIPGLPALSVAPRPPAPPPPPPPPPPTDPFYEFVVLLLHFDGSDGQTTTIDNSPLSNPMVITDGGALSTDEFRFGPSSFGTGGAVTHLSGSIVPDAMQFGNQNWTVEIWVYLTETPGAGRFAMNSDVSNGDATFSLSFQVSDRRMTATVSNIGGEQWVCAADSTYPIGTWTFVQVRRRSDVDGDDYLEMAVNGTQTIAGHTSMGTAGTAVLRPVTDWNVGGLNATSADGFLGFEDDARITVGVARDWDLPTAPFPNS